jgi:hypothetical protein
LISAFNGLPDAPLTITFAPHRKGVPLFERLACLLRGTFDSAVEFVDIGRKPKIEISKAYCPPHLKDFGPGAQFVRATLKPTCHQNLDLDDLLNRFEGLIFTRLLREG